MGSAYWEALIQNQAFDPDVGVKNIHALITTSCGGPIATEVLKVLANIKRPVSSIEIQDILKSQGIFVDAIILEKEILKEIEESPYKPIVCSNSLYWIRHELFAEYLRDLGTATSKALVDAEKRLTLAGRSFQELKQVMPSNTLINLLPQIPKVALNDEQSIAFIASSLVNDTPFLFAFKAEERHKMLAKALVVLAAGADVNIYFGLPDWSTSDGLRNFSYLWRILIPELQEPFVYKKTLSAWDREFRGGERFDRSTERAFLLLTRIGAAQEAYTYLTLHDLPIARA